eukprot:TRINITY_DN5003_c0_g1_i1.p1 TRINITY_DN5003_c0_g1~~TRINITY_DN5003_c0_g1_i1.p1  ORF type:complete len:619 (+),score=186.90 TRINITY_DN5003_c0_g1_i1:70-1926(+)
MIAFGTLLGGIGGAALTAAVTAAGASAAGAGVYAVAKKKKKDQEKKINKKLIQHLLERKRETYLTDHCIYPDLRNEEDLKPIIIDNFDDNYIIETRWKSRGSIELIISIYDDNGDLIEHLNCSKSPDISGITFENIIPDDNDVKVVVNNNNEELDELDDRHSIEMIIEEQDPNESLSFSIRRATINFDIIKIQHQWANIIFSVYVPSEKYLISQANIRMYRVDHNLLTNSDPLTQWRKIDRDFVVASYNLDIKEVFRCNSYIMGKFTALDDKKINYQPIRQAMQCETESEFLLNASKELWAFNKDKKLPKIYIEKDSKYINQSPRDQVFAIAMDRFNNPVGVDIVETLEVPEYPGFYDLHVRFLDFVSDESITNIVLIHYQEADVIPIYCYVYYYDSRGIIDEEPTLVFESQETKKCTVLCRISSSTIKAPSPFPHHTDEFCVVPGAFPKNENGVLKQQMFTIDDFENCNANDDPNIFLDILDSLKYEEVFHFPTPATKLIINIIEGINLPIRDEIRKSSDPYVKIDLFGTTKQTKCIKQNLNPIWNESITFEIPEEYELNTNPNIKFHCFDKDTFSLDDPMGSCVYSLISMKLPFYGLLNLIGKDSSGCIRVGIYLL